MNRNHLKAICAELNLGTLDNKRPIEIPGSRGGSVIWQISTNLGCYAIKQLSPDIDLSSRKIITKYELSEKIAHQFMSFNIPAVSAIGQCGNYLFLLDNQGYLVYPWVEGYTLKRHDVSKNHALIVSELIAKIHKIELKVAEFREPHYDEHSNDSIVAAIGRVKFYAEYLYKKLDSEKESILSVNKEYLLSIPQLAKNNVVTHGDIDQLNIIWSGLNNKPNVIDWESVKKMNPVREIVRAALFWSGMGSKDNFSESIYHEMLKIYFDITGDYNKKTMNAALSSVYGSTINWIMYNINIVCKSQMNAACHHSINEIEWCLSTMKRMKATYRNLKE